MIEITQLVAAAGFRPRDWQSATPPAAWGGKQAVQDSPELRRIIALPRRAQELDGTERAEAIIDMMTERFGRPGPCRCAAIDPDRHEAEGCLSRLRLVQALALREIGIAGGLLGPIGVGHGKTLIDLLAPMALAPLLPRRAGNLPSLIVLFVPPGLVSQLISDYEYIGQHFVMPSLVIQGSSYSQSNGPTVPVLQVMPYSRLQRPEATDWLRHVKPDAVIADECHRLRDRKTATTARVMRHFDENPITRFCGWSGSITSKSIRDYAHLSALALRGGSPLPIDFEVVEDWARAIDPSDSPADAGPLLELCAPGEHLHSGIRRRLAETVGVVTTTAPAVDCALEIDERPAPPIPPRIRAAIAGALKFERPDGEELVTAMDVNACACELACGFHYRWIFPKHEFPRDEQLIEDWRGTRKAYFKEVRQQLRDPEEHLDSPQLLKHAAQRFYGERPQHRGLPNWPSKFWPAWRDMAPRVHYESEAVRIDDYLVRDAAEWAREHRGIVWYQHTAFGEWLAELSGLPIYGGGKLAIKGLLAERGSCVVSIKAHGEGRNGLQFTYNDQLVANPPADPKAWEQLLGRLHRAGQRAPVVRAEFYGHTKELRKHVSKALRAALYVEGTLGSEQKLRMGFPYEMEDDEDEE